MNSEIIKPMEQDYRHLGFWKQILTVEYFCAMYTLCIYLFRINFYLGTVSDQIRQYAPGPPTHLYTLIFSGIIPGGAFLMVVIGGILLEKYPLYISLLIISFVYSYIRNRKSSKFTSSNFNFCVICMSAFIFLFIYSYFFNQSIWLCYIW